MMLSVEEMLSDIRDTVDEIEELVEEGAKPHYQTVNEIHTTLEKMRDDLLDEVQ